MATKRSAFIAITPVLTDEVALIDDPNGSAADGKADLDTVLGLYDARTATMTNKTLTDPKVAHRRYEDTTAGASAHTLVIADANSVIEMNNASAQTLTIPANASVAFAVGTLITVIQMGAGTVTILGDTGVTVSGNGGTASAGSCDIQTQYGAATLYKSATDSWVVFGDIDAVA